MTKRFRWRERPRFVFAGATIGAAIAAAAVGLAGPTLAATTATTATSAGYPPPKGMYKQFTNCPLKNPIMHETASVFCVEGNATSGSITLGNLTTSVTEPVNVQFGDFTPPGNGLDISPSPLAGNGAVLKTQPDLIPGTLTDALGCATATDATIVSICQKAAATPADNQVYALAEEVGPITEFNLNTWQQQVMFQVINPLLGSNCSIGTPYSPITLHPGLSLFGPGVSLTVEKDPNPSLFPGTSIIGITGSSATDNTFSAPGVIGCGPGGIADVAVDEALDAWSGLPATSGNSLTLAGQFQVAFDTAAPGQDSAKQLLAAFQASTSGEKSVKHLITTPAQLQSLTGFGG